MSKVQVDGCYFSFFLCMFAVFAEFSFTCLVGLTNALEQDGFISGFMGFYIKMVTSRFSLQDRSVFVLFCFFYFISLNVKVWMFLSLQGEPHLTTAYALMMSYWEGIVHFILFLVIIHRMFSG